MPTCRARSLAPVLLALLPACAAIEQEARATRCSYDGAFELGMNDGRAGQDMSSSFAGDCTAGQQPGVRAGYRDGYLRGLASRTAEHSAAVRGPPRPRAFLCEISAFGDTFTAFGATEAEAHAAAQARCVEKRGDSMFCREAACRPNQ